MKLVDYVSPVLPRRLSQLGVDACNAFERLPGELACRPNTPNEASSRVLSYGVPLAIIGINPSFEAAKTICSRHSPNWAYAGRVIQSSGPLRYAIVDGLNVEWHAKPRATGHPA